MNRGRTMSNSGDASQISTVSRTANNNYRSYLEKNEIAQLRKANNIKAASMFLFNWTVIAACFATIAVSTSLLITFIALLVMAGRQLGLGILLHECSHRGFFSRPDLNQQVGHWLAGMPLLVPMDFYRPYHMLHHSKTGTDLDPDVNNIKQYPVSRMSLLRKFIRDFTGLSGFKVLFGVLFYVLPNREGNTATMGIAKTKEGSLKVALRNFSHALIFHVLFFLCFCLVGEPMLYAYWWICFIFVYPFIIRVRQIAEHGALTSLASDDVRDTTRTTIARWWERCLFAPNYVNYHCEHHYLPTVPSYNLGAMHQLLVQRGFYHEKPSALVTEGYPRVLALATNTAFREA